MKNKDKTPIILYFGEFNKQLEAEIVVKEKGSPIILQMKKARRWFAEPIFSQNIIERREGTKPSRTHNPF